MGRLKISRLVSALAIGATVIVLSLYALVLIRTVLPSA
jgi:hypothetical protein